MSIRLFGFTSLVLLSSIFELAVPYGDVATPAYTNGTQPVDESFGAYFVFTYIYLMIGGLLLLLCCLLSKSIQIH